MRGSIYTKRYNHSNEEWANLYKKKIKKAENEPTHVRKSPHKWKGKPTYAGKGGVPRVWIM